MAVQLLVAWCSLAAVSTVISVFYWLKTRHHHFKAPHDWRINIDSDIWQISCTSKGGGLFPGGSSTSFFVSCHYFNLANMSNTRVTIDPNGDTLVILATKQDPPSKEPTEPAGTTESPTFVEKHFLCSQKHLTLASRRASKLFSSTFKEASKQDDGLYHWNFGDVFDVQAFEVVLKIIHGKARGVPQKIELDLLSKIASIVDDLECYDALSFCAERWLMIFHGLFYELPERMDKTLAQHILVSFVFVDKDIFRNCIQRAARYTSEGMPTFDLPIRADIPTRIEKARTEALQSLVDGLYKVHDDLLQGKLGCSEGCRAFLLGSLLQVMTATGLYPRPESPFYSLKLDSVISSLRDMKPSIYYSSVTDSRAGMHSGTWLVHEQSTSSSTTPPTTGGLFGTKAVARPILTPTPPSGGLFGTSTAPQPTLPLPAPSGTLFGTKTVPQTSKPSSSAPAKNEEVLKKLVQHSTSLKSFIDPLLVIAESKIQELKLDDFPQPWLTDS